jgi:hypothetical protein
MNPGRGAVSEVMACEPLDSDAAALYLRGMIRVFDMDDRARLPWRFFGAMCGARARA